MSSGGWAPSRDESETAVAAAVDRPKLYVALPVTAEVTSTLVQLPAVILPELPSLVAPKGGALAAVIVVSPQVELVTE